MLSRWARQCLVIALCLVLYTTLLATSVNIQASASEPCSSPSCQSVSVSPGQSDLTLGAGFPTFGPVKLSYPNSSIYTKSVGELLFTVRLGLNSTTSRGRSEVSIYVPPDFSGLSIGRVWTSFTNNYDPHLLTVSKQSASDRIGPNWWKITVTNIMLTKNPAQANPSNGTFLANQTQYIRAFEVTSPIMAGRYFFKAFVNGTSIGAGNFPTVIVKASRDPAYISGALLDSGERIPSLIGRPIELADGMGARVVATGTDYLGRSVSAQAFINSTAAGNYTLFGVAPGTYNITAYAAGYVPATQPITVSVGPTQSLESVDLYLTRSANITGVVLSKNAAGSLIPWGALAGFNGTTPRAITVRVLNLDGSLAASTPAPYAVTEFTKPASTTFNFAITREVGFDGRIPQDYANYTSGLASGDYLLYAYVTSYVQLEEVSVHVGNETTQTVSTIPLIRTGIFNVTVHFRNYNSTATIGEDHIQFSSTLTVSAYDQRGTLRAQNVTFVHAGATSASVELQGFSNSRGFGIASLFSANYGLLPGTYQIIARVSSSPSISGNANTGIRDFYYQRTNVLATIGLGDGVVALSLPVYKAGGINITIFSIDDQTPSITRLWRYPGKTINFLIVGSDGAVYQANATQPLGSANVTFTYVGLLTDTYEVVIQTIGYTQREIIYLNVFLGYVADKSIWMIQNPVIDVDVLFKHETLLTNITTVLPFAQPINNIAGTPARIEVFDDLGNFVAANVSYVPNNTTIAHFRLVGFDRYYGDPRFIWSGFYDTTDAVSQTPGGLILYPWEDLPRNYTVRIWIEGYYQEDILQVRVPARGNISVIEPVERSSRVAGTIAGPDFFEFGRPLSWATVTLEPDNFTLTRIIDVRPGNYTTFSLDGSFQLWVPGGGYGIGASLAGYSTYSAHLEVPLGSDVSMQIWLSNYQPSEFTLLPAPLTCSPGAEVETPKSHAPL